MIDPRRKNGKRGGMLEEAVDEERRMTKQYYDDYLIVPGMLCGGTTCQACVASVVTD